MINFNDSLLSQIERRPNGVSLFVSVMLDEKRDFIHCEEINCDIVLKLWNCVESGLLCTKHFLHHNIIYFKRRMCKTARHSFPKFEEQLKIKRFEMKTGPCLQIKTLYKNTGKQKIPYSMASERMCPRNPINVISIFFMDDPQNIDSH